MRARSYFALSTFAFVFASALQAQEVTFMPAPATLRFGSSVALSADTAAIGSWPGPTYIYTADAFGWSEQAQLFPALGEIEDGFGMSSAIEDDTCVVAAPWDAVAGGSNAGSAWVFVRSGSAWSEEANLLASDGRSGDGFGSSVALFGDTIVVGAPGDDGPSGFNAGSAYVFVRAPSGWVQQAKLTASDARDEDRMGCAVSISGNTVVVGARGGHQGAGGAQQGAAYVFVREGTTWVQQAKLSAADGTDGDLFGCSVSCSGDLALVGASNAGGNGLRSGWAYIYGRAGTTWTQQARLVASDASDSDTFGSSVAISGGIAIVGAQGDDNFQQGAGAAYVFLRAGSMWVQHEKLTVENATVDALMGSSAAVLNGRVLLGAPRHGDTTTGAAYLWSLPSSESPPVAAFTGLPRRGKAPLTVSFDDASAGDITGWYWTFGNGYSSTLQNPVFTFQEPGIYDVSLLVTGPDGADVAMEPQYVEVLPRGPWTTAAGRP